MTSQLELRRLILLSAFVLGRLNRLIMKGSTFTDTSQMSPEELLKLFSPPVSVLLTQEQAQVCLTRYF